MNGEPPTTSNNTNTARRPSPPPVIRPPLWPPSAPSFYPNTNFHNHSTLLAGLHSPSTTTSTILSPLSPFGPHQAMHPSFAIPSAYSQLYPSMSPTANYAHAAAAARPPYMDAATFLSMSSAIPQRYRYLLPSLAARFSSVPQGLMPSPIGGTDRSQSDSSPTAMPPPGPSRSADTPPSGSSLVSPTQPLPPSRTLSTSSTCTSGRHTSQPYYPSHFMRGTVIQLANGELKRVEELNTEDFVRSANLSSDLKMDSSTVVKIEEKTKDYVLLCFSVGENRVQVSVEATVEHPFFVIGQGWSSCSPQRARTLYGLPCQRLQVGDICISLTHRHIVRPVAVAGKRPREGRQSVPPEGTPRKRQRRHSLS